MKSYTLSLLCLSAFTSITVAAQSTLNMTDTDACPVSVKSINPSHESFWNNMATSKRVGNVTYNDHNKFLEIKMRNNLPKEIRGIKFLAAYYDSTEDLHTISHTWGLHDGVKPNGDATGNWDTNAYQKESAIGWVVMPVKILYSDGSVWQQKSDSCVFEWWKDKKHPRVNKMPSAEDVSLGE